MKMADFNMQVTYILILTSVLFYTLTTTVHAANVEHISFGILNDQVRLVIESNESFHPKQVSNDSFDHIELQLDSVSSESVYKALPKRDDFPSIIKSFYVTDSENTTSLAIELNEAAHSKLFEIESEDKSLHRTVLDIYPIKTPSKSVVSSRVGIWSDRTRFVIESEKELDAEVISDVVGQTFKLLFRNLDPSQFKRSLANLKPRAQDSPLIDVSIGSLQHSNNGEFGVVFELMRKVSLVTFKLKPDGEYHHRFVMDFFYPAENTSLIQKEQQPPKSKKSREGSNSLFTKPHNDQRQLTETWLDVRLNKQQSRKTVLALSDSSDALWLPKDLLVKWGVILPLNIKNRLHSGVSYLKISDLGIKSSTDMTRLSTELTAPAETLKPTNLSARTNRAVPLTPSPLGGFVNYDITGTYSGLESTTTSAGYFEVGAFNGWGSGTSTALVRKSQKSDKYELTRLNTTWRKDYPDRMRSLVVGDSVTKSTSWSGAARFGGIQWGSNFSTKPGYITTPLLSVSDKAVLPSSVDVYVNDALRFRDEVPSGPFSIDDIPAVSGPGETRVVIKDILGRERVFTQSFYSSSTLLRKGLNEHSIELGFLRESFSRQSNTYGAPIAAATWRHGLTNSLTIESHAHISNSRANGEELMAGLGAAYAIPFGAVVTAAVAGSQNDKGAGSFHRVGFQKQGHRINLGITLDYASKNYMQFGSHIDSVRSQNRTNAYIGTSFGPYGTVSLGYTKQTYWNQKQTRFGTANYSLSLGRYGQFTLSALHFPGNENTVVQAMFTLPLSPGHTASTNVSRSKSQRQGAIHLQKNLPLGEGVGYQFTAHHGVTDQYKASASYQSDSRLWSAEIVNQDNINSYRGSVKGGFAYLGSELHSSRLIDNSFGVVRLEGFEDVRIYSENIEIAKTNKNGYALVPRLRAYETNKIRIEQSDLPLEAHISEVEVMVSPFYRSGIFIDFPVDKRRSVTFNVVDKYGEPLPLGTVIKSASGKLFPVGYRGEVFISPLEKSKKMIGMLGKQQCEFELALDSDDKLIMDAGKVQCHLH